MNHPEKNYVIYENHFVNDYYDVLKYILDTGGTNEIPEKNIEVCKDLFYECLNENFSEIRAEYAYELLCEKNDSFEDYLYVIAYDGEAGRRKIHNYSLYWPIRALEQRLINFSGSETETKRRIASDIEEKNILSEAGLRQVTDHMSTFQSGCISAERVGLSKKENKERTLELQKSLKSSPYHFIEVQGVYVVKKGSDDWLAIRDFRIEQGDPKGYKMKDKIVIKEKSFFVYDYDNAGGLYRFMEKKMNRYEQEDFLFIEPSGDIKKPIESAIMYFRAGGSRSIGRKISANYGDAEDMIDALMKGKVEYSTRVRRSRYFVIREFADRDEAQRDFLMEKALEYGVLEPEEVYG